MPWFDVTWTEMVTHSTRIEAKDADEAKLMFSKSNDDEITDLEFIDVLYIEEV